MNPYEASLVDDPMPESEKSGNRVVAIAWGVAFLYPLIAVGWVYFCWGLGWYLLGHWPRPSIDDPKDIGGAMDYVYSIGLLLVVFVPPMSIGGLVLAIFCPIRSLRERRFGRVMIAIANALMSYCVWQLATLDPGSVFAWFFD